MIVRSIIIEIITKMMRRTMSMRSMRMEMTRKEDEN